MKFLYIIDYWVPEKIGTMYVIASSDQEALQVICERKLSDDSYIDEYHSEIKNNYIFNDSYKKRISEYILSAKRFPLLPVSNEYKEFSSGVVYFISQ